MRSLKSVVLILLLIAFVPCAQPRAADVQSSQVNAAAHVRLICESIKAPDETPPRKSCDDLCTAQNAVCVWNSDNVNPNSCETPTNGVCRCCHLGE
jgi:hypothetical protein